MASVEVRCTVNNCYFWAQDNNCEAPEILVTADGASRRHGSTAGSTQTDTLVSQMGETPARDAVDTACHTFRAR